MIKSNRGGEFECMCGNSTMKPLVPLIYTNKNVTENLSFSLKKTKERPKSLMI
jgi:hypothetical protein